MDDDAVRRGRPAAHVAFGVPTATRAGAALLALAFRNAGRAYAAHPQGGTIVRTLGRAAGADGMVGGQWLDIAGAGVAHDIAAIEAIHRRKTGALIGASVVVGALAAGADGARVEAFERAGAALGLAFQVVDDILDLEADAASMGKPVGADAAKGKTTVPAVLGVEGARARASELLHEASGALAEAGAASGPLAALARFVVERRR
jgi:geranylgeranyl pyrophosphate synthase